MPLAQAGKNANPHGAKQFITILTKTVSGSGVKRVVVQFG
jgi:hypothetical protein